MSKMVGYISRTLIREAHLHGVKIWHKHLQHASGIFYAKIVTIFRKFLIV